MWTIWPTISKLASKHLWCKPGDEPCAAAAERWASVIDVLAWPVHVALWYLAYRVAPRGGLAVPTAPGGGPAVPNARGGGLANSNANPASDAEAMV